MRNPDDGARSGHVTARRRLAGRRLARMVTQQVGNGHECRHGNQQQSGHHRAQHQKKKSAQIVVHGVSLDGVMRPFAEAVPASCGGPHERNVNIAIRLSLPVQGARPQCLTTIKSAIRMCADNRCMLHTTQSH